MKHSLFSISVILVVLSTSSACSDDCDGETSCGDAFVIDINRSYSRLYSNWDTRDECLANADEFFTGCSEAFELCTNGAFMVVVTDIINSGSCEPAVADSPLKCTIRDLGDLQLGLELTIQRDPFEVAEFPVGRHPWVENELDEFQRDSLAISCDSIEGRDWWNNIQ